MTNVFGAIFCFCLFVAFRRIARIADALPVAEIREDEEFSSNDFIQYRVESDEQDLPVELKRI